MFLQLFPDLFQISNLFSHLLAPLNSLPAPIRKYEVYDGGPPSSSSITNPSAVFPQTSSSNLSIEPSSHSNALSIAPTSLSSSSSAAARFDAIILSQHAGKAAVHTRFSDLVEKDASSVIKARPSAEEEAAVAAETQRALEGAISKKLNAGRSAITRTTVAPGGEEGGDGNLGKDGSRIIRYVADKDAAGYSDALPVRVIKMVEAQVDPLEPPKFKHKKVPSGPADAAVPIMRSPPRKVGLADQEAWKIPSCVSNWKNARGYVVPLDKRVAADGRGLLEPTINDGFAKLSESLLIAERKARVEVETRAAIQRKLQIKAKEDKEAELRALAAKARMGRAGIIDISSATSSSSTSAQNFKLWERVEGGKDNSQSGANRREYNDNEDNDDDDDDETDPLRPLSKEELEGDGDASMPQRPQAHNETDADYSARLQRERERRELKRGRDKISRLDGSREEQPQLSTNNNGEGGGKRSRFNNRDDDRDVSEKIALGLLTGQGVRKEGGNSEALYDARLFNQSEGVGSGFGNDDEYNVYGQAWRSGSGGASVGESIYRPRAGGGGGGGGGVLSSSDADKAISSLRAGASSRFSSNTNASSVGQRPAGPVEFERGKTDTGSDPFGLDSLLASTTTSSSTRKTNALDALGKGRVGGGFMSTVAGGSSLGPGESSGRTSLEFARSK